MSTTMNTSRIDQLRKLHALDPTDADVSYMIAQELGKSNEHAQAIGWYEKCIEADAAYCYAYFFKAMAQHALDQTPDAIKTIQVGLIEANKIGHPKTISELTSLLEQYSA